MAAEPLQGAAVRYRLAPWEHGHAIRRIERYDEGSERARVDEKSARTTETDKRLLAILLSPILGHLPGLVQKRMERDFGAPAVAMTIISALPLFALATAALVVGQASALGGVQVSSFEMLIAAYVALESSLRMASAILVKEPMGSLLGYLGYWAYTVLRGTPAESAPARPLPAAPDRAIADRFTMLEPLLSFLPPADQAVLERRFGFDRLKWGRRMSLLILLVAGANVLISLSAIWSRTAGLIDWVALLVGGFFVVEQIRRRRELALGRPAASVLGALVRPLAKPLLAGL